MTAAFAVSAPGTLAANTATPVQVRAGAFGLWVINRSPGTEIWVRLDGTPAAAAAGSYVVTGARNFPVAAGNYTISLFSTGTPNFSVEGAVVVP